MRAVILAGGLGTRLREETEYRPKPMVEIGSKPIIWHIMKNLSQQGLNDFIICLGYKGDLIRDFFINYQSRMSDLTLNLKKPESTVIHGINEENWNVTLADTGLETMTGGRIHRIRNYLKDQTFLCTYGDGLADIDFSELLRFHRNHGKIATVTAVLPTNRFGSLKLNENCLVESFVEKPKGDTYVSGGYFIFEPDIFKYLNSDSVLEREPIETLVKDRQLVAFKHSGFWQPMDTYRESQELNSLWATGKAPWRNW